MDSSEIFQTGYKNPPVSPVTNPPLILDAGLQLAKERKYRVQSEVRRLMAKKIPYAETTYGLPQPIWKFTAFTI